MQQLEEVTRAPDVVDAPGDSDSPAVCDFCGILATAACPPCDARRQHAWGRHAPDPELEENCYPGSCPG